MITTNFKECCQNCQQLSVQVITQTSIRAWEEAPRMITEISCQHRDICCKWRDEHDTGTEGKDPVADREEVLRSAGSHFCRHCPQN